MDYLKIVLDGYLNANTQPFLEDYFFREIEKGKKENYSSEEFYNGCKNITKLLKQDLNNQLQGRKSELNKDRVALSKLMITETDPDELKDLKDLKASHLLEIQKLQIHNFSVNLNEMKWGGYNATLNLFDIQKIDISLDLAFKKTLPALNQATLHKKIETEYLKINEEIDSPLLTEEQFLIDKKKDLEEKLNQLYELQNRFYTESPSDLLYKKIELETEYVFVNKRLNTLSEGDDAKEKHRNRTHKNSDFDLEFITGSISLSFVPQGNDGYFKVTRDGYTRKYTLKHYFDCNLRNWTNAIDKAPSKTEKLKIASNGIFRVQKDLLDESHPGIIELMNKNLTHLKDAAEYIKSNYKEDRSQSDETGEVNNTSIQVIPKTYNGKKNTS